jgi:thiol-disulfide isomerase/thioredoxin
MPISKSLLSAVVAALLIAVPMTRSFAADTPATPPAKESPALTGISAEFKPIFTQITSKIKAGKNTEADLTNEIAAIDALIAKHSAEKTDEVAMIALMKARLYLEVFEDTAKGIELLKQIKTDYPQSAIAKNVDQAVDALEKQEAAESKLAVGKPFPPFTEKDLNGKPLALADFKGKIVLVDFWATWCGPCVEELPNVLAAYQKYHDKGFEIIGISLDQNRDALTGFIKERGMTWAQYFDGLGWKSKLGEQYGIQSIPSTFLLDKDGIIIAKNLRGSGLSNKLATLLK